MRVDDLISEELKALEILKNVYVRASTGLGTLR